MISSSSTIAGVISFDKVCVKGDLAHVTLTVPFSALSIFKDFLGSAFALSSFVTTKSTHNKALLTAQASGKMEREKRYQDLVKKIMVSYEKHSGVGVTFREVVRMVKDDLVSKGHDVTCGMIEPCIRQNLKPVRNRRLVTDKAIIRERVKSSVQGYNK